MTEPTDVEIDNSLALDGFNPRARYPEYGHDALRFAYRSGWEDALLHAQPVAEWLIAEEHHKGELAAAYWRDDILPAVRQADSGFLQRARQSIAALRRVHSPYRGDGWRSKPDVWYCGRCLNGDGSPAEWPCESAEHLYSPDEWNTPPASEVRR